MEEAKMWQKIKDWCRAHPRLVSSVSFILFFLWLGSLLQWPVALMLAVSLAIHEYSHVWAMKKIGMRIEGVIFIPFLGAVALGGGKNMTRSQECFMAMAGPLMGYLSALPVYIAMVVTENPMFGTAFIYIVFINFFNMLPLSPLDGGRIIKSILMSFKNRMAGFIAWGAVGAAAIYVLFLLFKNVSVIFFALIVFMAFMEFLNEWQLYKLHQDAKEILSKYKGLDEEGKKIRLSEEYIENIKILEFARKTSGALRPLTLKSGIAFGLIYLVLAGWPIFLLYVMF